MTDATPADIPAELPAEGTPEWHALEAELHLEAADRAIGADLAGAATARLLAATAHAQLGALKLAIRHQALGATLEGVLYDVKHLADRIADNTEATDINTRKR